MPDVYVESVISDVLSVPRKKLYSLLSRLRTIILPADTLYRSNNNRAPRDEMNNCFNETDDLLFRRHDAAELQQQLLMDPVTAARLFR